MSKAKTRLSFEQRSVILLANAIAHRDLNAAEVIVTEMARGVGYDARVAFADARTTLVTA